jgi:uncharacterized protein (TIGR02996 family)
MGSVILESGRTRKYEMLPDPRLGQLAVLPDPSGLLAAIMLNPAEDTPRLMYADWLNENERPERAEYIRSSIHVPWDSFVRLTSPGTEPFTKMGLEPTALPPEHLRSREWSWVEMDGVGCVIIDHTRNDLRYRSDRGFLELVCGTWDAWLRHGDALRAREWVPRVKTTTIPSLETLSVLTGRVEFNFTGRPMRELHRIGEVEIEADTWKKMMEIEWPGTEFELPG